MKKTNKKTLLLSQQEDQLSDQKFGWIRLIVPEMIRLK